MNELKAKMDEYEKQQRMLGIEKMIINNDQLNDQGNVTTSGTQHVNMNMNVAELQRASADLFRWVICALKVAIPLVDCGIIGQRVVHCKALILLYHAYIISYSQHRTITITLTMTFLDIHSGRRKATKEYQHTLYDMMDGDGDGQYVVDDTSTHVRLDILEKAIGALPTHDR